MRLGTLVRWAVLALILAIVFVPMYWIVVTSFKTGRQILLSQNVYAPQPFTIENYLYLFEESRFALWFRNSAITATASTLLSLVIGTAGAYALTRLRFAGRRTLGAVVLVTYLVPPGLMPVQPPIRAAGVVSIRTPNIAKSALVLTIVPPCMAVKRSLLRLATHPA